MANGCGNKRGLKSGNGGPVRRSQKPVATVNDAIWFVSELKHEFRNQKEKFRLFHQFLVDYRDDSISYATLVGKVKELLRGHNKLIMGFNYFIEKDFWIELDDETAPHDEEQFMNKIKNRFQDDELACNLILDTISKYKEGLKDITEVSRELAIYIEGNEDLVEDFTRLLERHGCGDVVDEDEGGNQQTTFDQVELKEI
ncbi:paired amphipathic helix protein Sin3-like 2 [Vigna unguiculata]|uniref:paired amphipathic helix protein Sin3-like 2 n=1 Tax=Vigna unguiculata TaxID=3917 RepID=UPI001016BA87|nr:paired amphipathic helix protein Sin3-like 2 [Vigna unguiculata]